MNSPNANTHTLSSCYPLTLNATRGAFATDGRRVHTLGPGSQFTTLLDLPAGLYVVRVASGSGVWHGRVVVE